MEEGTLVLWRGGCMWAVALMGREADVDAEGKTTDDDCRGPRVGVDGKDLAGGGDERGEDCRVTTPG